MKIEEIAQKYKIDDEKFTMFMRRENLKFKDGLFTTAVDDDKVELYVKKYLEHIKQQKALSEQAQQKKLEESQEEEKKKKALASMLISSGFSFDGYKITKYSGYISGDDCVTMPRSNFWGDNKVSDNLCNALVKIRRQAIKELKEAAYNLGCNAVVGVDFDYLTMDPQHAAALNQTITVYEPYVICVTANGNAVVIEKIDDSETKD